MLQVVVVLCTLRIVHATCAGGDLSCSCEAGAFLEVGSVTTLAGRAMTTGSGDGVGTSAMFNSPFRAAITPDGAMALVTDTYNCKIRSVSLATGDVSTFGGTGCGGVGPVDFDGIATSAKFGHVSAIAISPDGGAVVVSDEGSPVIRAIDMSPPRNVSIFAGASEDFAAGISGLAFSADGARVFVLDKNNFGLRVIDVESRQVSTVLSNLEHLTYGIAISPDDHTALTAADGACNIRIININDASIRTLAGGTSICGFADGIGTHARFGNLVDDQKFSVDISRDGRLALVGDWANHAVRTIDMHSGEVKTLAGSGRPGYQDGKAQSASFRYPTGVAFLPDGRALVVDRYNHLLRIINLGECKGCAAGTYSSMAGATSCALCSRGAFQNLPRATTCSLCPQNTSSALPGSVTCQACSVGSWASVGSAECVCGGRNCPAQGIGYGSCDGPEPCDCGDGCLCGFYRSSDCSDYCCPCPAGTYCDCFSACEGMPKPCPEGSFSRVIGASDEGVCQQCPDGHVCNKDSGTIEPVPCPAGHFCPVRSAEECPIPADPCHIPCPAGTAGNRTGMHVQSLACVACPVGFFGSSAGNQQCSACLPGSYSPNAGSSSCKTCPIGHFCSAQASIPQPCPAHTFNSLPGASSLSFCIPCEQEKLGSGAPSSRFCNRTETTVSPTTTRSALIVSTTSTTIAPLQPTPAPFIPEETPRIFLVQARAQIGVCLRVWLEVRCLSMFLVVCLFSDCSCVCNIHL